MTTRSNRVSPSLRRSRAARFTLLALVLGCGRGSAADDGAFVDDADPMALTWVSPGATLAVGEPIALSVATQNPGVRVVHFALDGREIGVCDASDPDADCHGDALWQWTATTDVPGAHALRATALAADGQTLSATLRVDVAPIAPVTDETGAPSDEQDPLGDDALIEEGTGTVVAAVTSERGYLDPSTSTHALCGGQPWSVDGQRVELENHTRIDGSVSAVARCMANWGDSVRRYADLREVSRASVVAQLVRAGECADDAWHAGLVPVAACVALTHTTAALCAARLRTNPDYAIDVLTRSLSAPSAVAFHRHDPPRMAVALEGRTRATCSRRDAWHLLEARPGSIDAYVAAYNAYRTWEHGAPPAADPAACVHGVAAPGTTPRADAPAGTYRANRRGVAAVRELSAIALDMAAGERRYLDSVLSTAGAATRTAVSQYLTCRATGSTAIVAQAISGQNLLVGGTQHATTRFVFTAPSAGSYRCALEMTLTTLDDTDGRPLQVVAPSYVEAATTGLCTSAQAFDAQRSLVADTARGAAIDAAALPAGVARVTVVGDVEVTSCYAPYHLCPAGDPTGSSEIDSQLVFRELRADGSICRETISSLEHSTVGYALHHYKIHHALGDLALSTDPSCDRRFTAFVRLERRAGNLFEIEPDHETVAFVIPRP